LLGAAFFPPPQARKPWRNLRGVGLPLSAELLGEDTFFPSCTDRESEHDDCETERSPCAIEEQTPDRSGNDREVHRMSDVCIRPRGNQPVLGVKTDAEAARRPEHLTERPHAPQIQGKAAEEEWSPDGDQDNPQPRLGLDWEGTPKQSAGPNEQDRSHEQHRCAESKPGAKFLATARLTERPEQAKDRVGEGSRASKRAEASNHLFCGIRWHGLSITCI
jgi:hypothetical protein